MKNSVKTIFYIIWMRLPDPSNQLVSDSLPVRWDCRGVLHEKLFRSENFDAQVTIERGRKEESIENQSFLGIIVTKCALLVFFLSSHSCNRKQNCMKNSVKTKFYIIWQRLADPSNQLDSDSLPVRRDGRGVLHEKLFRSDAQVTIEWGKKRNQLKIKVFWGPRAFVGF